MCAGSVLRSLPWHCDVRALGARARFPEASKSYTLQLSQRCGLCETRPRGREVVYVATCATRVRNL